jgi:hypothetical protein
VLLQELAETYRSIIDRYRMAAVAAFRLSVVKSELGLHVEAAEAARLALARLPEDPHLLRGRNSWLRSTIQRRVSYLIAREADQFESQIESEHNPTRKEELRHRSQELSVEAVRVLLSHVTEMDNPGEQAYYARLEYRRRINNLVDRATKLLEVGLGWQVLEKEGLNEEGFRELVAKLCPDGIESVPEWRILHTIGAAHHILGDRRLAAEAGQRLVELIQSSVIDDPESEVARIQNDAQVWQSMDNPPLFSSRVGGILG